MSTGRMATHGDNLLYNLLIPKSSRWEEVVVHHVTDGRDSLQLEIERRDHFYGTITFERLKL